MNQQVYPSMSIADPHPPFTDKLQQGAAAVALVGFLMLILSLTNKVEAGTLTWISLVFITMGTIVYGWRHYMPHPEGIKNNGVWFSTLTNRGLWGWLAGIVITFFYVCLYWYPHLLGLSSDGTDNWGLVAFFDPISMAIKGKPSSQWFVYGVLYTLAILIFGVKFILKYRHNRYQVLRTISVMFFQLCFAFMIPEILDGLNKPSMDLKNMWPLNYYFFFDWNLDKLVEGGNLGMFMLIWGIAMILIISPVLTYFYGKRWYCSWVCGCGGLAETAGDPFRHLSDKSLKAWKIERWLIHSVLVFAVIMTFLVLYTYITGQSQILFLNSYNVREWYGFLIGAAFSGVVGVGFYPLMGSRVWCRFGCPMAAILGLQQRFFSRFRITTNGGQCISCGNCSTYCEMGIDVRAYAQRGQNIVRASCVGCGICAAVCPRGVLRLENGSVDIKQRTSEVRNIHVPLNEVGIL
ncbi:MAG: 4Fe-4S binding protein [Saprospiraceae bacterium]|nr:4Fe-4S binding protein [Saprospiraceae bacterium]